MKKLLSILLASLLLLNLAACGEKNDLPDDAPAYGDKLIKELYAEEGDFSDPSGGTVHYSYHVPQLVSETAVAAAPMLMFMISPIVSISSAVSFFSSILFLPYIIHQQLS